MNRSLWLPVAVTRLMLCACTVIHIEGNSNTVRDIDGHTTMLIAANHAATAGRYRGGLQALSMTATLSFSR
jgi:hypothetical protein